jgi:hypothetical protein
VLKNFILGGDKKILEEGNMVDPISVFDCDGHIIESIPEMAPFLDPVDRDVALTPSRNRQGVFASLDDIHYPRNVRSRARSKLHAGRGSMPVTIAKARARTGSPS